MFVTLYFDFISSVIYLAFMKCELFYWVWCQRKMAAVWLWWIMGLSVLQSCLYLFMHDHDVIGNDRYVRLMFSKLFTNTVILKQQVEKCECFFYPCIHFAFFFNIPTLSLICCSIWIRYILKPCAVVLVSYMEFDMFLYSEHRNYRGKRSDSPAVVPLSESPDLKRSF